jgi:CRISPR-associated protein Cas5d
MNRSKPFKLKVSGRNACFTRPEMKAERVSYDVMTPSAARGVLEAISWKPAILWRVSQIDVLNPIKWESVRRNEVGKTMSPAAACLYVEDERQQRAGLFLRDVAYTIHAHFEMTDKAGPEDNVRKFEDIFERRAKDGQCFQRPYLGCREFGADFELIQNGSVPEPIRESRDLGWMFLDYDYGGKEPMPRFFRAMLEDGKVAVPTEGSKEADK